ATMRPSRMPTTACRAGAPVPSTSVPPRISVSTVTSLRLPLGVVHRGPALRFGVDARVLLTRRRGALGFLRGAALLALGLQLRVGELAGRAEVAAARGRLSLDRLADRQPLVFVE